MTSHPLAARILTVTTFFAALLLALPTASGAVPPANDDVLNAIAVPVGVPIVFSNVDATVETGEPDPGPGTGASCNSQDGWCLFGAEPIVNNSVWFTFVAPSGLVTIDAGPADLQAAVWEVADPSNFATFTEIAANDDSGPIFAPAVITCMDLVPGATYYIQIDGFGGTAAAGQTLLISESSFAPDDVADALPLSIGVPQGFDNRCATVEVGEPDPGPGTGGDSCNAQDGWCAIGAEPIVNNSVWFTFVAPPQPVTIETVSADLQLALWQVGDPANFATFAEVAANDDSGPVFAPLITPVTLVPGATYYVQVDGYLGTSAANQTILVSVDCPCFDLAGLLAKPPITYCYDRHGSFLNSFGVAYPGNFVQVTQYGCRDNALYRPLDAGERESCHVHLHDWYDSQGKTCF